MSWPLQSYDALFNAVLTDYQNQFPEADVSQGSLIYHKSAALASALWGLYRHQDYLSLQIFPDTAQSANMEHHAWVFGLARRDGETDAELLARLLARLRQAPAGGNAQDYEEWAKSVDGVKAAYCVPLAQGLGTVDVLILATGEDEIPDQELLDAVYAYIDVLRPVTASVMRVLAPTVTVQDVSMTVEGDVQTAAVEAEIEVYMEGLEPGETLAQAQLAAIAVNNGASNATIINPPGDVPTADDEMIRPGAVNVTAA